ncbi:PREDICTED: leucine-rich repeat-containing protein 37A-like [Elephantulus edwardii]|uniref:leucine-rich repeat-containing protein 37A-like n=1 Tax=Elephantulus edwardii TaxID=28737 RepID=UPI0003F08BCC|nr:PREDICTED: leucine-rich repeat-containing protein 37A-like [Elephantulus edwardii]
MTITYRDQVQDKQSNLDSVTGNLLNLDLTTTVEPGTLIEHSTAQQKVTHPSEYHEGTALGPDQAQGQQPNLSKLKPVDVEITVTPKPNREIEPYPTKHGIPTQSLGHKPKNLELTITPDATTEVVPSTTLQKSKVLPTNQVAFHPSDLEYHLYRNKYRVWINFNKPGDSSSDCRASEGRCSSSSNTSSGAFQRGGIFDNTTASFSSTSKSR